MKSLRLSLVPTLLFALLVANGAAAQARPFDFDREGFWATLGVGAGVGNADCSNCENAGVRGGLGIFELAAGSALSPTFLIGGVLGVWTAPVSPSPAIMKLAVRAQYYPLRTDAGFYTTASFGLGGIEYTSDTVNVSSVGRAFEIGAGWDRRFLGLTVLSPFVTLLYITGSRDVDPSEGIIQEERFSPWAFTAGVRLARY